MIDHKGKILLELGYETADLEISVIAVAEGEIIGLCQDFDSVRKAALTSDVFLKGSRGGPSAIVFLVK